MGEFNSLRSYVVSAFSTWLFLSPSLYYMPFLFLFLSILQLFFLTFILYNKFVFDTLKEKERLPCEHRRANTTTNTINKKSWHENLMYYFNAPYKSIRISSSRAKRSCRKKKLETGQSGCKKVEQSLATYKSLGHQSVCSFNCKKKRWEEQEVHLIYKEHMFPSS